MDNIKNDLPNFWYHMERIANIIQTDGPYFQTFNGKKEFGHIVVNVGLDKDNNTYNTDYPSNFVTHYDKECGYQGHPFLIVNNEIHPGTYPIKTDNKTVMEVDRFLDLFDGTESDEFDEFDEFEIFI